MVQLLSELPERVGQKGASTPAQPVLLAARIFFTRRSHQQSTAALPLTAAQDVHPAQQLRK